MTRLTLTLTAFFGIIISACVILFKCISLQVWPEPTEWSNLSLFILVILGLTDGKDSKKEPTLPRSDKL